MSSRESLPPVTIRGYEPGDEVAILETFNRVFSEGNPAFQPRSMAHWRWVNQENPSGSRIRIAVAEDGRIAAHVAGIAQRVRIEGGPGYVNQSVDGFSHPDWRRVLKRPGVYAETLNEFNRTYAGPPPDRDSFVWGLPVLGAWRIGQAYCFQKMVRTQNKLVLEPERLRSKPAPGVEIEEVERFPGNVAELFDRAAAPHGVIAVRDAPQLDWRFADHPAYRYDVALARAGGRLVGYAVYRYGFYDGDEGGLLCDWLVEPGRDDAADSLRVWLSERTAARGTYAAAVFPDTIREWIDFQRAGFYVAPTSYFPTVFLYGKRIDTAWLHRRWYYTLGDSDLC